MILTGASEVIFVSVILKKVSISRKYDEIGGKDVITYARTHVRTHESPIIMVLKMNLKTHNCLQLFLKILSMACLREN